MSNKDVVLSGIRNAKVKALIGDERPHRAWLRTEGAKLHAFGR